MANGLRTCILHGEFSLKHVMQKLPMHSWQKGYVPVSCMANCPAHMLCKTLRCIMAKGLRTCMLHGEMSCTHVMQKTTDAFMAKGLCTCILHGEFSCRHVMQKLRMHSWQKGYVPVSCMANCPAHMLCKNYGCILGKRDTYLHKLLLGYLAWRIVLHTCDAKTTDAFLAKGLRTCINCCWNIWRGELSCTHVMQKLRINSWQNRYVPVSSMSNFPVHMYLACRIFLQTYYAKHYRCILAETATYLHKLLLKYLAWRIVLHTCYAKTTDAFLTKELRTCILHSQFSCARVMQKTYAYMAKKSTHLH